MGKTRAEKITGRKPKTVAHGLRIFEEDSEILRETAKIIESNESDLLRTAWHEFIENHELRKRIAKAKAKRAKSKAK